MCNTSSGRWKLIWTERSCRYYNIHTKTNPYYREWGINPCIGIVYLRRGQNRLKSIDQDQRSTIISKNAVKRVTLPRSQMKNTQKYILLISIHGLIRGQELELGRDADTGGQTKYVLELAQSLSKHPEIQRVDLMTRLLVDPQVSSDYSQPVEHLNQKANIIRISCGTNE